MINSQYIHNINSLVNLADINFRVCDKIYKEVLNKSPKHPGYDFLLLTANNAFNEAVGILHTLLCSTKNEEIRIKPAIESILEKEKNNPFVVDQKMFNKFLESMEKDYPNVDLFSYNFLGHISVRGDVMAAMRGHKRKNALQDFDVIKKNFEKSNFHKIRHQTTAHKNKKVQSIGQSAHLLLREDLIENLGAIMKDLKLHNTYWFDYSLENHNDEVLIGLDEIIKKI